MQNTDENIYRVVIHYSKHDEASQRSLINHVRNILQSLPGTQVEIVSQGQAIQVFSKASSIKKELDVLPVENVSFLVCRNSLIARQLLEDAFLARAQVIPSAVAHLILRQHQGWAYLKE